METIRNKKILVERGKKNTKLKKKLGERCVYCGCNNTLILTIDHKIPICRGGKDNEKNKQVTCYICNQIKGPLTDKEFRKYYKLIKELYKLKKISLYIQEPKVTFHSQHYPDFKYKNQDERCEDMIDEAKSKGELKNVPTTKVN